MNFKIQIIIVLLLLVSCKKSVKTEVTAEEIKHEETITNNIEDTIPVYKASFMETATTELLSKITNNIQSDFIAYPFNKDRNELEETKTIYQSKGFLKTLASDFKNKDFLEVASINYALVVPKTNTESDYISIQQWQYTDIEKAKSAFESLKNYKETEIHFKTINWIWVYQEDNIYLVFARNFMVTDVEMQSIKNAILKTVTPLGDYETIQFYE